MNKHTAGPWSLRQDRKMYSPSEVIGSDGKPICELWARADIEKEKADAHLVAAAPELLEALIATSKALDLAMENLREHEDNCFLHDAGGYARCFCGKDSLVNHIESVEEQAQAAIAKSRGEA